MGASEMELTATVAEIVHIDDKASSSSVSSRERGRVTLGSTSKFFV